MILEGFILGTFAQMDDPEIISPAGLIRDSSCNPYGE